MTGENTEYLALPPRAQAYVDIAYDTERLEELATANPDDAANYAEQIARGRHLMHMFEEDAANAFVAVAEHAEPAEAAKDRSRVMDLINDPTYGPLLTAEDIKRELSALPDFTDYDPSVRALAETYLGKLAACFSTEDVPRPASAGEGADGESAGDDGEAKIQKPKLTVTLYRDLTIEIGEDGEKVPLLRAMDIPKSTEEERQIAQDRWGILKTIASHEPKYGSKRGLSSRDTWIAYAGDDSRYSGNRYADDVVQILTSLEFEGKPLVSIEKTSPVSKRRYHENGAFDITFVESLEHSGLINPNVFELPNGEILFGKRARIAHALMGASEDAPFTPDMLEESDVYSDEDRARHEDGSLSLSSAASYLRRELGTKGVGDMFELSSVRITGENPLERPMAYWLKYVGEADLHETHPHLYPNQQESEAVDSADTASINQAELPEERERSIAEFRELAGYLHSIASTLEKHKIPVVGEQHAQPEEAVIDYHKARKMIGTFREMLSDERFEILINRMSADDNDPRWDVVNYLTTTLEINGREVPVCEAIMDKLPKLDMRLDYAIVEALHEAGNWKQMTADEQKEIADKFFFALDPIGDYIREEKPGSYHADGIVAEVEKRYTENYGLPRLVAGAQRLMANTLNKYFADEMPRVTKPTKRNFRRAWLRAAHDVFKVQVISQGEMEELQKSLQQSLGDNAVLVVV